MKNKIGRIVLSSILVLLLLLSTNVNFKSIFSLPNDFVASYDEIDSSNLSKKFGAFVSTKIEKSAEDVSLGENNKGRIVFKLFGFIPIRSVDIAIVPEEEVYVGGVPIGVSISTQGAIVINESVVLGESGREETEKSVDFKAGDLIYEINGKKVKSIEDIPEMLTESDAEVKFLRKNKTMKAVIKPVRDVESGKLKLGLLVKDDISGIGTLTYVNKQSGDFGALGHSISEADNPIEVESGNIYNCSLVGIDKGKKNDPGQLRCVFVQNSDSKGKIEKNSKYGVFGQMQNKEGLVDENLTCKLGGRLSVSPGKAYVVSSVSGIREEYEIEIIKASYQKKAHDKSIVFRVKDKRLLELTGGIVQGMSGSPIMQNGKLVGAITHVFTSDSTKGYGVYVDWMVEDMLQKDIS